MASRQNFCLLWDESQGHEQRSRPPWVDNDLRVGPVEVVSVGDRDPASRDGPVSLRHVDVCVSGVVWGRIVAGGRAGITGGGTGTMGGALGGTSA